MIYQMSVRDAGESELRTSNLLDLLGCVVHELGPSALVFFHAGHGLGFFRGLRDVIGFDGVHCEDRPKYRTRLCKEVQLSSMKGEVEEYEGGYAGGQ